MTNSANVNELVQLINIKDGILGERKSRPKMKQLLREAAGESIVLLENDGVLPIKPQSKVAVFGRTQLDYFFVGYGSGGEVNPPEVVNVIDGLKNKSVQLYEPLAEVYEEYVNNHKVTDEIWGQWPRYFEEMSVDDSLMIQAAEQTDVAIIVIGRAAGEDRENILEAGSYFLTEKEAVLVEQVTKQFEKVVLVINSGNVMDLTWTEQYNFSAILFAWQGGMESGNALADLLVGDVNPSGKLPDTIARHYEDYPSSENFGQEDYVEYVEDIFVGYRYFETFHPEKVLYPFGYGLSYSKFSLDSKCIIEGTKINITTNVTNVGKVAGKQTVQVYYHPPQGRLGKSSRNLIRFAKTQLLKPNESQEVELTFNLKELASYDDTGVTGHPFSYLLEAGDYEFLVGDCVTHLKKVGTYSLKELTVIEELSQISAPNENFKRLVAETIDGKLVKSYLPVTRQQIPVKVRIDEHLESFPELDGSQYFLNTEQSMQAIIYSLSPIELDALTRGEGRMNSSFGPKGNAGMFGGTIESLRDKGIPPIITTDGPAGIRLNYYASLLPCGTALASTWNLDLIHRIGKEFGKELHELGSDIILAPGINIHRNPLGGRNFEYFSEDPYLTGKMASSYVKGVQTEKVSACPKHFACNNQETNRNYNDSRVSERALREIYLKAFEICIKEAQPHAIMAAYNKINGIWAHYHYDLMTEILRNEWGFQGCVMTDWWMRMSPDPNYEYLENNAYRIRAQVDILMPGGHSFEVKESDDSLIQSLNHPEGIHLKEVQRSAFNILKLIQKLKG